MAIFKHINDFDGGSS